MGKKTVERTLCCKSQTTLFKSMILKTKTKDKRGGEYSSLEKT